MLERGHFGQLILDIALVVLQPLGQACNRQHHLCIAGQRTDQCLKSLLDRHTIKPRTAVACYKEAGMTEREARKLVKGQTVRAKQSGRILKILRFDEVYFPAQGKTRLVLVCTPLHDRRKKARKGATLSLMMPAQVEPNR
jgi:hypothetical protein